MNTWTFAVAGTYLVIGLLAGIGWTIRDPGNPGETITLYDLPEQVYDEPVRVILVTNGSVERDGTRRRYGLTVPAGCTTAVGAAAWTFGVDEAQYAELVRAT